MIDSRREYDKVSRLLSLYWGNAGIAGGRCNEFRPYRGNKDLRVGMLVNKFADIV